MCTCEACGYAAKKVRWFLARWPCQPCIDEFLSDMQGNASDLN